MEFPLRTIQGPGNWERGGRNPGPGSKPGGRNLFFIEDGISLQSYTASTTLRVCRQDGAAGARERALASGRGAGTRGRARAQILAAKSPLPAFKGARRAAWHARRGMRGARNKQRARRSEKSARCAVHVSRLLRLIPILRTSGGASKRVHAHRDTSVRRGAGDCDERVQSCLRLARTNTDTTLALVRIRTPTATPRPWATASREPPAPRGRRVAFSTEQMSRRMRTTAASVRGGNASSAQPCSLGDCC